MRVRAQKSFSAYVGSQILQFERDQEVDGDLALALVEMSCAVDVLDDPDGTLEAAAQFHEPAPGLTFSVAAEPEPVADPEPVTIPVDETPVGPVASLVRARSSFRAYDGANVVDITEGQEIAGDLAAALAAAGCDVEVLAVEEPAADTPADPAVPAAPAAPAGDEAFDPAEHNVQDVLAYVREHPEQRETILAAEKTGKQRTTLLAELADQA